MNAVIAEESVLRGRLAGFWAGLGAATADAIFFVLAYLGVVAVVESFPLLQGAMIAIGGVLMLYFAIGAARGARASFRPTSGAEPTVAEGKGFRKALVLALTNPYQVLFWLTIGVGLLRPGELDVLARLPVVGEDLAGTLVVATGSPALIGGFFWGANVDRGVPDRARRRRAPDRDVRTDRRGRLRGRARWVRRLLPLRRGDDAGGTGDAGV